MTKPASPVVAFALAVSAVACINSGSGSSSPDASTKPTSDAPPAITGLGQPCGTDLPACAMPMICPPEADPAHAYCTSTCYSGAFSTDAEGTPIDYPNPASGDAACANIYSAGAPGVASCAAPYHLQPPAPLTAMTNYTLDFVCIIKCSTAGECPQGLHCNADAECTP